MNFSCCCQQSWLNISGEEVSVLSISSWLILNPYVDPKKETEKKLPMKSVENKNKFSQAKLLAGAVKHSSDGGNSVKRLKLDTDHDEKNQEKTSCVPLGSSSVGGSTVHCSSAAVCIGILPESSSDSEGTINSTGKIISSVLCSNNFFDGP
uniref:Uncharacterized protein n=1 Tax=Amazona collaria TaxID=241587 RepID=A0A8B9GEW5_9PSIT